jgi:hypothetical protein
MRKLLLLWPLSVLLLAGCSSASASSANGGSGNGSSSGGGADGGVQGAGSVVTCTPNQPFCDGNALWQCTRSGQDAVNGTDCTSLSNLGTASNPAGCFTTLCPSGQPACCRLSKAACVWELTTPAATGTSASAAPALGCSGPTSCASDAFSVFLGGAQATCPSSSLLVEATFARSVFAVGQAISFPPANPANASVAFESSVQTCFSWTGTLTWNADVPNWEVTFDLTCSEAGKSAIQIVGTMSGAT